MSNFKFKKFDICQTNSAMKVGTDGVLLGAWACSEKPKHILDIGAGTGLITLMLAQRYPLALLDGVEPDQLAIIDTKHNFEHSDFADRLTLHHERIQNFNPKIRYDLIVSNPPYFERSLKPEKDGRRNARHDSLLSFEELMIATSRLLTDSGNSDFIIPSDREQELVKLAYTYGLHLNRKTAVRGKEESPIKRVLVSFSSNKSTPKVDELVIEKRTTRRIRKRIRQFDEGFLS